MYVDSGVYRLSNMNSLHGPSSYRVSKTFTQRETPASVVIWSTNRRSQGANRTMMYQHRVCSFWRYIRTRRCGYSASPPQSHSRMDKSTGTTLRFQHSSTTTFDADTPAFTVSMPACRLSRPCPARTVFNKGRIWPLASAIGMKLCQIASPTAASPRKTLVAWTVIVC